MCNPLALGIAAGGAQAVTGIMQQNRQHQAQVDAVTVPTLLHGRNTLMT